MQPLLKIQSIPIKIEAQTKRATLQHSNEPAPVQQKRAVRSAARQVAAPAPAPQRQVKSEAKPQPEQRVNQQARSAQPQRAPADSTGNYLQEASSAVQAYNQSNAVSGTTVAEVAPAQSSSTEQVQAPVAESAPAQAAASTSFDYSMDRETFDWNATAKPQLEYVPASIEYSVAQYPEVVIEYVGEPIYVPASSNPNYVPPPESKGKA